MLLVLYAWPSHHTQCRSPSNTRLQLFGDAPLIPREELSRETTFAAECGSAYLKASLVSQVLGLDFEF